MGHCYVLCGRSGVTWTVPLHIIRDVNCCSSPPDVARRGSRRARSSSGSGRRYLWRTSFRGGPYPGPPPKATETQGIAPSLLFKKNFAVAQVLKAGTWRHYPRPEGPGTQVPQDLPPGPCGGSTGPGLTLAVRPGIPSIPRLMTDG